MLFLINKTQPDLLDLIALLAGDEDRDVLLVQDAAFYAVPLMVARLLRSGVENVYVAEDALATRAIQPSPRCESASMDRIVELIMEDHDKVVCL